MGASEADIFARLSSVRQPVVLDRRLRRAVVLGGSVAGLLAARVLSDHADEVVILDRDDLAAETGTARNGVPHGRQVHALLAGGRAQIERWFPKFTQEAVDAGATLAGPRQVQSWVDGVRAVATPNMLTLNLSRVLLEGLLRRRTNALGNVRTLTGTAVGLRYGDGRVAGVRYRKPGDTGEHQEDADFVVDAMGRASRLSEWLEGDGWPAPELERMRIDINYATAYFERPEAEPETLAAVARYSPGNAVKEAAAAGAIEGSRWILLLCTYGKDRLSGDLDEFRSRLADLPPVFRQIAGHRPIGPIHSFRMADARRRRYDRLSRLPGGLVSVGDAVASFNPVYGQGISSAALHASCLSEHLCGTGDPRAAAGFFQLQRVVVDAAWELSNSVDAQRTETSKPGAPVRLRRAVIDQVMRAARTDKQIGTKFNDVAFMLAHPSTLATLPIVLGSLMTNLRRIVAG